MIENKFKTYLLPGIKGKTDLKSTYPYFGEWNTFSAYGNITEEEYLKDISGYEKKVIKYNENYIKELIKKGEYLKPFNTEITTQYNPIFDDSTPVKGNLESYRVIFLDHD